MDAVQILNFQTVVITKLKPKLALSNKDIMGDLMVHGNARVQKTQQFKTVIDSIYFNILRNVVIIKLLVVF